MSDTEGPLAARRLVDELEREIVDLDAVLDQPQDAADDASHPVPGSHEPRTEEGTVRERRRAPGLR